MAGYWRGPWVWLDNAWQPPADAIAALDLRNRTACATPITPLGDGLFVTANATDLGAAYTNFGTDPDAILSGTQKLSWQARFVLPNSLAAQTLREALWETLTIQADPTGEDRCAPIVPTMQRQFELWLGGARIFNRAFAVERPEWTPVIDMLKRQYRAIRQQCLDGQMPPEHYRKVCGAWVRKYRLNYRTFQPSDLPDEPDLPPTTTVSDNFNDGNLTGWTTISGTWSNPGTTVRHTVGSGDGGLRFDTDLSSDDHYCQIKVDAYANNSGVGPAVRKDSTATETYYKAQLFDVGTDQQLEKREAGVDTQLATNGTPVATGSIYKLQVNGSSLECFDDGVSTITATDTAITGNLRCALNAASGGTGDDFEAGDLPTSMKSRLLLLGVGK